MKKPNVQMIATQSSTASGNGHQSRISLDRTLVILWIIRTGLLMLYRNQKLLYAGIARAQHRLHHDALRCFVIG